MLKTTPELIQDLAGAIKTRRLAMGWPQQEAAARAGVAYRTWRRLETQGRASIEDLVRAAVALRCEDGLASLFPPPAAVSLDDLLERQARVGGTRPRSGARRRVGDGP